MNNRPEFSFEQLPLDIVTELLGNLSLKEIATFARISRYNNSLFNSSRYDVEIWPQLIHRNFKIPLQFLTQLSNAKKEISFEHIYRRLLRFQQNQQFLPKGLRHFFNHPDNHFSLLACCTNDAEYAKRILPMDESNLWLMIGIAMDADQIVKHCLDIESVKNSDPEIFDDWFMKMVEPWFHTATYCESVLSMGVFRDYAKTIKQKLIRPIKDPALVAWSKEIENVAICDMDELYNAAEQGNLEGFAKFFAMPHKNFQYIELLQKIVFSHHPKVFQLFCQDWFNGKFLLSTQMREFINQSRQSALYNIYSVFLNMKECLIRIKNSLFDKGSMLELEKAHALSPRTFFQTFHQICINIHLPEDALKWLVDTTHETLKNGISNYVPIERQTIHDLLKDVHDRLVERQSTLASGIADMIAVIEQPHLVNDATQNNCYSSNR